MENYAPTILDRHAFRRHARSHAGFTLVEVAVALGIVIFGLMAVFGLLPAGLDTFGQSMNTVVSSQIIQQVISETQETEFDLLIRDKSNNTIPAASTGVKAIRYFDVQGREMASAAGAVYFVNTRIQPATDSPASPRFSNPNLATVTIQVAHNPSGRTLGYETDSNLDNLWSGTLDGTSTRVVPIITASALVSRQ